MLPYWFLFIYFAVGALLERPSASGVKRARSIGLMFGALIVALMIGFRYLVGGDWGQYARIYQYSGLVSLDRVLGADDPGYMLINWVVNAAGLEIWAVNLVCGIIFTWGLVRLVQVQPAPWLAMLVAVPYLIIVVSMGYSRQAVAIGILMAALASLHSGGSTLRFALYAAVAAPFHKTAVFALPLVTFASTRNRLLNLTIALLSFLLLYTYFLEDSVDTFLRNYVEKEYSSQGAAVRLVMTAIPAVIFLAAQNKFGFTPSQRVIWRNMSVAALALLVALAITPSSTAIDRLALYVIPLQIVILSRLPSVMLSQGLSRVLVTSYSAAVLFVWLNFAVHADAWVPYRIYPLFE